MDLTTKNQRPVRDPWNIGFGAVASIAALIALFIWIPYDIKGGFIEINQIGKPEPGDAFFPIILARSEERRVGKECRSRWSPYH